MTTIAYRAGVLAADTQASRGGAPSGYIEKIARAKDGRLTAACGSASFLFSWLAWARGDEPNKPKACEGDFGLFVDGSDLIEVHDDAGSHKLTAPYYAMGSGRCEATGAMFAGADPETAVRAAIAHSVGSGGDVMVLKLQGSVVL